MNNKTSYTFHAGLVRSLNRSDSASMLSLLSLYLAHLFGLEMLFTALSFLQMLHVRHLSVTTTSMYLVPVTQVNFIHISPKS